MALHIVNQSAEHCSNSRLCMTFLLLKASTGHHVVAVFLFVRSLSLVPTGMDVYIVVSLVPLFVVVFFYNLDVVAFVVDHNVLPSSYLDPSLPGFPRDGEDSLLVYQEEESSRILDFFEKRFSFLLRGVSLNFLIKEFQLVVMM